MESDQTIDYRLNNIEKTLSKVENLLLENKLQARDIQDLQKGQNELLNAFNSHEQRIKTLEQAPLKAKADRWQQVVDLVFKIAITIAVGATFAKMGFDAVGA